MAGLSKYKWYLFFVRVIRNWRDRTSQHFSPWSSESSCCSTQYLQEVVPCHRMQYLCGWWRDWKLMLQWRPARDRCWLWQCSDRAASPSVSANSRADSRRSRESGRKSPNCLLLRSDVACMHVVLKTNSPPTSRLLHLSPFRSDLAAIVKFPVPRSQLSAQITIETRAGDRTLFFFFCPMPGQLKLSDGG